VLRLLFHSSPSSARRKPQARGPMWEADVGRESPQPPAKAVQRLRQRARPSMRFAPGAVSPDYRPRIGKQPGRTNGVADWVWIAAAHSPTSVCSTRRAAILWCGRSPRPPPIPRTPSRRDLAKRSPRSPREQATSPISATERTVATNALIQDRGAATGLITSDGFRDLLEIGRQKRPHL
jgi:hypothetical protein